MCHLATQHCFLRLQMVAIRSMEKTNRVIFLHSWHRRITHSSKHRCSTKVHLSDQATQCQWPHRQVGCSEARHLSTNPVTRLIGQRRVAWTRPEEISHLYSRIHRLNDRMNSLQIKMLLTHSEQNRTDQLTFSCNCFFSFLLGDKVGTNRLFHY